MVRGLPRAWPRAPRRWHRRRRGSTPARGRCPRAGELNAGGEGVKLLDAGGIDQVEVFDVRDQRGHAVVAQASGVNAGRNEGAAKGVHLDQRGEVAGVAEVVGELALVRLGQAEGSTATMRAWLWPFQVAPM